jgi:hypothetical protein
MPLLLTRETLPATIADAVVFDDLLCRSTKVLVDELASLDGDIMMLGVGGKMGPTVPKAATPDRRVISVARFAGPGLSETLAARGVGTIAAILWTRMRCRPCRGRGM